MAGGRTSRRPLARSSRRRGGGWHAVGLSLRHTRSCCLVSAARRRRVEGWTQTRYLLTPRVCQLHADAGPLGCRCGWRCERHPGRPPCGRVRCPGLAGGPHAPACAAPLADRCAAAATIAGVAPYPAEGLDWMADMGQDNVDEFSAALAGGETLEPAVQKWATELRNVQGLDVAASLRTLVSDVDKRSLTGEFADMLAESFRRGVSSGIAGWCDDDLAFVRPWGFDLGAIQRPVAVWQGGQDRMVPFAHGGWLVQHIRTAQVHLYPDEGHLSLAVASLERIVTDLAALGKA